MNSSNKFDIYMEPETVDQMFGYSPFNLKRDLKEITLKQRERIAMELAALLLNGPRDKVYVEFNIDIYGGQKITNSKFRVSSIEGNKGKRGGLRVIAIVDNLNKRCIVLHIYSKNKKKNINQEEKNIVKKMLKDYKNELVK